MLYYYQAVRVKLPCWNKALIITIRLLTSFKITDLKKSVGGRAVVHLNPFTNFLKLLYGTVMEQPVVESDLAGTSGPAIAWLERELGEERDKYDLYIIAGELSLALAGKEFFESLERAIGRGKNVWIFCGPRIMISDKSGENGGSNRIIDLIGKYGTESSLHILYIEDLEATPPFHFCLCGDNVIIEKPHLPNAGWGSLEVVPIRDSVLWSFRLRKYLGILFNDNRIKIVKRVDDIKPYFRDEKGLLAYTEELVNSGWYDGFPRFFQEMNLQSLDKRRESACERR
ncbi:MAG TPA: hypothetical protein VMX79_08335 [bacterium]|nr:hypothetical protein [bacterium]